MSKFLRPALFILVLLLVWSFFATPKAPTSTDDVILQTNESVSIGKAITVDIFNNSKTTLSIDSHCPANPLKVEKFVNGKWEVKASTLKDDSTACEKGLITIEPQKTHTVNFAPWNAELFDEIAKYRIDLEMGEAGKTYSVEVEVTSPSVFRTIWESVFYKPIFNTLIFLISVMPEYSLGLAVILLTLIIKLLLLAPNHKALMAQKQMQKVQPQLDALKKKYQNDPQALAQETMAIWKKHKVSPVSSCLPLLIQFPILIALFYVVKDGMAFTNPHLLYAGLQNFDTHLTNTFFLGMDLTKVNFIVLPILIGLLQFIQMKLSLPKTTAVATSDTSNPLPMMNKTMLYFMPLMIAFFTASVPAAVAMYWGTSTLFGIGQQLIVNRSKS